MIQEDIILGATGGVGKFLARQIIENGDTNYARHKNPSRITGLASNPEHDGMIYSRYGLSDDTVRTFLKGYVKRKPKGYNYGSLENILDIIAVGEGEEHRNRNLVFIDATAERENALEFHLEVIRNTNFGIVTANKNPLILADFNAFQELTKDINRYGYRATVMAGSEAVDFIQRRRDLSDPIYSMDGCLSGTLNYITSELSTGRRLSEIIRDAIAKKFSEPNPVEDLSGADTAKKILILARTAGFRVDYIDIEAKPFIPPNYLEDWDFEPSLERIKEDLDERYFELTQEAKQEGEVLKYVSRLTNSSGEIGISSSLDRVPLGSELGSIKGANTILLVTTDLYPKGEPQIIIAKGASQKLTAANLRSDLLNQLQHRVLA